MEQDIEGIITRVMNRLLEPIRQEMRNGFRDVNTNIAEIRADIRRLRLSSIRVCSSNSSSALCLMYSLRPSTRGGTMGLEYLTRS